MKLRIFTALILLIAFSAHSDDSGIVNLTSGGSYISTDGTQINCTATVVKQSVSTCFCQVETLYYAKPNARSNYAIGSYPSQAACLSALVKRPDCN